MLYWEIIAVCSQIHTKHINTLCGQNVELLNIQPGGTYCDHWALEGFKNTEYSYNRIAILDLYVLLECRRDRWGRSYRGRTSGASNSATNYSVKVIVIGYVHCYRLRALL